jgi:proline iminopeptidase
MPLKLHSKNWFPNLGSPHSIFFYTPIMLIITTLRIIVVSTLLTIIIAGCWKGNDEAARHISQTITVKDTSRIQTGGIRLVRIDGKYNVWTKKVGDGAIKVLLLHGGPGMTHEYFECFESYFPQSGVEFYYYDQLGSFYSDQPNDTTLWRTARFVEELEQVRKALGLTQFYLLGHSWGGILGMEYALTYPKEIKGLIISNMVADVNRYVAYNKKLRSELPDSTRTTLEKYEAVRDFKHPIYQDIVFNQIYAEHVCRIVPFPDPVQRALKHVNEQIYVSMQGPNEFIFEGVLEGWSAWDRLPNLNMPTLVIGSRYDTMNPNDMEEMSRIIPHSRYLFCPNGSHMSMYDDQAIYIGGVLAFLSDVHTGKFTY